MIYEEVKSIMEVKISNVEEGIYSKVIIVLQNDKTFRVLNITDFNNPFTIAHDIKDADTALLIQKAYCDGYYDGSHK